MRENILFRPARHVQQGTVGQEAETGGRQFHPAFAYQRFVQNGADAVQVQHIGRRIFDLFGAERGCAPVGRLLLLDRKSVV